ncbi:MAG: hypothetical protein NVSMB65_05090 [Chloroflexota bacterium]
MQPTQVRAMPTAVVVRWARIGYLALAWLFVACVIVQAFLAGLSVFADPATWSTHRDFAYAFGFLTLFMLVLAVVGRYPRPLVGLTGLLLLLFALQSVFIALRASVPSLAALHVVNALAIFWLGLGLARRARAFVPRPLGAEETGARGGAPRT